MSKRTIGDYVRAAFLARDKATADAIVKDAEEAIPMPDPDAKEPDGDEGGDKHASNIHIHVEHGKAADSIDSRVAKLEDGMTKLTKSFDGFTKAIKDGELPPWLKKDGDGDDDSEGESEGDDDDGETKDVGSDPSDGEKETGALTMEKPPNADPDLMEADPSLKTGEMMTTKHTGGSIMGDAAPLKAIRQQVKDVRARAEILSPGIKFATFDAKQDTETQARLCSMRRAALVKALGTKEGKQAVGSFSADAIKGMSCGMARTLFVDASDRMADANNAGNRASHYVTGDDVFVAQATQVERLRKINEANASFWAKQSGAPRH